MLDQVRRVVAEAIGVEEHRLGPEDDLYRLGLTSHGTVDLLMALEDEFEVEFPDELLRRESFSSVHSILRSLRSLGVESEG